MNFLNKVFGVVSFKALQKQIDKGIDPIAVKCSSDEKAVKVEDFMKARGYYLRKERDNTTTNTSFTDVPISNRSNINIGSTSTSQSVSITLVFSKQK
ncbi:MAG: hypothetical protein LBF36_00640 [Mycoplasmataceae bacterium]|jgi:hypothetical protein|nr:hypothetical protein [Mycoplasmataceae bacterium]